MLLSKRDFTRREPARDAKKIFLFCEGKKRESQYFDFFQGIDSRINLIIHRLTGNENNSPTGLYQLATEQLLQPNSTQAFLEGDEVWFVVDTDAWGAKTSELRALCHQHPNWKIAQSNPCFEVWLYLHWFETPPDVQWPDDCRSWKNALAENLPGGFQSNRHPILIGDAIPRAAKHFRLENEIPALGCTEVFRLAQIIYNYCGRKIDLLRHRI